MVNGMILACKEDQLVGSGDTDGAGNGLIMVLGWGQGRVFTLPQFEREILDMVQILFLYIIILYITFYYIKVKVRKGR
jgi:hypothetical protein